MTRVLAPLAAVAAATALVGCASDEEMASPQPAAASAHYTCDDGSAFDIRFTRETREVMTGKRTVPTSRGSAALILDGGRTATLAGQPVSSGMHYSGDGYDFRGKGEAATLIGPDGVARTCRTGS